MSHISQGGYVQTNNKGEDEKEPDCDRITSLVMRYPESDQLALVEKIAKQSRTRAKNIIALATQYL